MRRLLVNNRRPNPVVYTRRGDRERELMRRLRITNRRPNPIVYTRRRDRRSVANGSTAPASPYARCRSLFHQICTLAPPSPPSVSTGPVAYARRIRTRATAGDTGISTSIQQPLVVSQIPGNGAQEMEDSNEFLSGSEADMDESYVSYSTSEVDFSLLTMSREVDEFIRYHSPEPEAPVIRSPGEDGSNMPLILTDATLLDCPICAQPLNPPIYQCAEGHIVCQSCCDVIQKDRCYYCRKPFGGYRCRAVEKILESVQTSCCYKPQGCWERFSYDAKHAHEKTCRYAPSSSRRAGKE